MGSPRIKGTTLSLLIDGVDYWADATSVVMDGESREIHYLAGGTRTIQLRSWLDVQGIQSTAVGSLWRLIWENPNRDVPFAYAPNGNPIPSEQQPHFTGILTLPGARPRLGGQAGAKTEQTFSVRLHIAQGPLRVTTL